MINNLLAHIEKFVILSDKEKEILQSHLEYKKLKKKDFLLKENQVCTVNHFIVAGCLRMYYITEEGTEQMIQFGIETGGLQII